MKRDKIHIIDWELIITILEGSATEEEQQRFKEWLSDEQNKHLFREIENTWEKTGDLSYCFDDETEAAWQKVNKQTISKTSKVINFKKFAFRIAQVAALILVMLFVKGFWFPAKQKILSGNIIISDYRLPDNSAVSLNCNSKLTYIKEFKGSKRRLWLEGEGFFDVQRNPEKPFIIETGAGNFEVLGTSFNIRAFEEDDHIELNVKTGKVRFTSSQSNQQMVAEKGQAIVYDSENDRFVIRDHVNSNFLSWKTKKLVFENTSLEEVARSLVSVYNINVIIKNEQIKDLRFSASFDDQTLEKVLKVIALTFDIEVNQVNGTIELDLPAEQVE